MAITISRFGTTIWSKLLCCLLLGVATCSAHAGALPQKVDGQPLPSLSPMLQRVTPAVVNIITKSNQKIDNPVLRDPFFKRFFSDIPLEQQIDGTGSGVIIHPRLGHILTNFHVLEGAEEIIVTLNDSRRFKATIIGVDRAADLAVIGIQANNLSAIRFGDSNQLRVGDFVVAIGNPYGIGQSVTSGIVSALHRNPGLGEYENFIQTDASINLGNSGGALVNLRGELVGINTAILGGSSGGNIGIGFAIPVNTAAGIIDQIVRFGQVERGMLGITVHNVDPQLAQQAGLPTKHGAVIQDVAPNSAAFQAGLRPGDIIVRINHSIINSASDVKSLVGSIRAGSVVGIVYNRNGKIYTTRAKTLIPVPQPPTGSAPADKPIWEN